MTERMPVFVGCVTLAAGAALLALPGRATEMLGLADDQQTAVRLLGASDLVLVPGLLGGRPRWPWMIARAGLNLAQAAYFHGAAARSSAPTLARASAGALFALTFVDGATGLSLRRG